MNKHIKTALHLFLDAAELTNELQLRVLERTGVLRGAMRSVYGAVAKKTTGVEASPVAIEQVVDAFMTNVRRDLRAQDAIFRDAVDNGPSNFVASLVSLCRGTGDVSTREFAAFVSGCDEVEAAQVN